MLTRDKCGLLVVDVQGSLALNVHNSSGVLLNIERLIQCCKLLQIPIIWFEQYPKGLGKTVESIASLLPDYPRFEKQHFNALSEPEIAKAIKDSGRTQWLVTGIEAHICVYQTVRGLLARNYDVEVVTDAISSRAEFNVEIAKQKLLQHGAQHTSVEMAVYELLEQAGTSEFKSILPIIK